MPTVCMKTTSTSKARSVSGSSITDPPSLITVNPAVKLPDVPQRLDQDIRLADRFFMHGLDPRQIAGARGPK